MSLREELEATADSGNIPRPLLAGIMRMEEEFGLLGALDRQRMEFSKCHGNVGTAVRSKTGKIQLMRSAITVENRCAKTIASLWLTTTRFGAGSVHRTDRPSIAESAGASIIQGCSA
jgi:hypothetical protein